jgi:hypothetical protein
LASLGREVAVRPDQDDPAADPAGHPALGDRVPAGGRDEDVADPAPDGLAHGGVVHEDMVSLSTSSATGAVRYIAIW